MEPFQHPSGRTYQPLAIAEDTAIPARVPASAGGQSYLILLYASIAAPRLEGEEAVLPLDRGDAYLVMRVALDPPDAPRRTLLIRKVALDVEYDCGPVFITFPGPPLVEDNLRVARLNLNGTGRHGTRIVGGIAAR